MLSHGADRPIAPINDDRSYLPYVLAQVNMAYSSYALHMAYSSYHHWPPCDLQLLSPLIGAIDPINADRSYRPYVHAHIDLYRSTRHERPMMIWGDYD